MDDMFERLDLATLTPEQIAPLDALFTPQWSDTWRELATSQYITLLSAPGGRTVAPSVLAQLAVVLTLGIAEDMGGSQPYIPVGMMLAASAKARQVIKLLEQPRISYLDAARATGMTVSRVRQIDREWRRQQIELRQGRLPLD